MKETKEMVDYRLKELLKKQIDRQILKANLPSKLMVEMLEELINLYKN
jgi:hypothetical protein